MPQNILYGIFLRIYYEPHKTNIKANIDGIKYGTVVEDQDLRLINIEGEIKQVHYVGLYEDVNYQTDGNYRQWQYTYYRGKIQRHIGSASDSPYSVVWDTRWVPDQNKPFSISAIVEENNGLIKILDPVENLTLSRNYNILLCKPFNIPQLWATREGEFTHNFNLPRNPKQAEAFQLVLSTWSPGYFNGIYLNEWVVFTHEGNNYTPGFHRIELDKCHMLNWGINTIKTGKTPKVFDNMVHGTEVLYPGIMVLVRFPK
jgi:hypothetical protein